MKCKDCEYQSFSRGYPEHVKSSGLSSYYCKHPDHPSINGATLICKTKRGCEELTIKTSPKWCPLKVELHD